MTSSSELPHQDSIYFRTVVENVGGRTGFLPHLVEKDYFCSLILRSLYLDADDLIIFKGGTLLNKVYMGFYRLSEDLDFSVSIAPTASRKERSKKAQPLKGIIEKLAKTISGLRLIKPLIGSNNSSQYNALFEYDSVFEAKKNSIQVEIGLREEMLEAPSIQMANTLVTEPLTNQTLLAPFPITCLTKEEAYAEKSRAALARQEPAIRDLFDIDYAIQRDKFLFENPSFKKLLVTKLSYPVQRVIDLSSEKKRFLKQQIQTDLRPVLRPKVLADFNFESAWRALYKIGSSYLK